MYVTTFYSYKGGVGRTMALINVAMLLANAGKRVLVVDFDLEAPGIPSFEQFRQAESRPGVVDYVCAFRDTGRAPDVNDFIVPASDGNPLWLMPAGRSSQPGYAEKLYSIDWKDLYDNHEGFLMFEDMRNQWAAHEAQFDYVLVDSRTGHTDVGGICTRQLPNSVVIMFLPNEQNIEGLEPIVGAIHEQSQKIGHRNIDLHFCASNVPDLDDEHNILSDKLEEARARLGAEPMVVNHYNSLELLNQPAFAMCRPKSKLARQYQALMDAIVERNFEDPVGAELALTSMRDRYEEARISSDQQSLFEVELDAARLASLHAENGKIAWLLSILYSRMGAIEDELDALNVAIDGDYERSRALIRRARLLSSLNRKEPALADLNRLLEPGTSTVFEIQPIIDLLRALEPQSWMAPVKRAIDQLQVSVPGYKTLMSSLMSDRDKLPLVVQLGQRARSMSDEAKADSTIRSYLILALIGLGQFEFAMEMIGTEEEVRKSDRADDIFNFAIAQWGLNKKPSVPLFERVIAVVQRRFVAPPDANVFQCIALSEMVLGRADSARSALELARSRARTEKAFSCWRYLDVTGREMLRDLDAMEKLVDQVPAPEPEFFAEFQKLV
jgi:MinD-like ATPase involved in chromosome partitioning or flagellar assembly